MPAAASEARGFNKRIKKSGPSGIFRVARSCYSDQMKQQTGIPQPPQSILARQR